MTEHGTEPLRYTKTISEELLTLLQNQIDEFLMADETPKALVEAVPAVPKHLDGNAGHGRAMSGKPPLPRQSSREYGGGKVAVFVRRKAI